MISGTIAMIWFFLWTARHPKQVWDALKFQDGSTCISLLTWIYFLLGSYALVAWIAILSA